MATEKCLNQYKVIVISKYKDFDGTERESKTSKTVYAKSEQGAISQVTKAPKKITRPPNDVNNKESQEWNDRASQFVTDKQVSAELLKENCWVIV